MKAFKWLALLVLAGVLVIACAVPMPQVVEKEVTKVVKEVVKEPVVVEKVVTATPIPEPEEVVILQAVDAVSLDPIYVRAGPGHNIARHLFSRLVQWDVHSMEIVPDLAVSWDLIDDLTWQFKLREGVVFHNGKPMDAEAVKFSVERYWEVPNSPLQMLGLAGVEIVDDYTVNLVTEEPRSGLLTFLRETYITPPEYYGGTPEEEVATQPIGCGPYKFVEWVRDDHVTMEAFPGYWGGAPEIDRLVWRVVPDASSRLAELETGAAEISVAVLPDQSEQVENLEGINLVRVPSGYRIQIGLRHNKGGPLADTRVRQAINYAVNVDHIIQYLQGGNGVRMTSVLNPPYLDPSLEAFPYDLEKAQALMAEAGYPDGFQVKLMCPIGRYLNDVKVCQTVASDLGKAGIETELETLEWSVYIDLFLKDELDDMWLIGHGGYWEGQRELTNWAVRPQTMWHNEEFHALWDELEVTMDEQKRREILNAIQALFLEDPPNLMLWKGVELYGVLEGLEWATSPVGIWVCRER